MCYSGDWFHSISLQSFWSSVPHFWQHNEIVVTKFIAEIWKCGIITTKYQPSRRDTLLAWHSCKLQIHWICTYVTYHRNVSAIPIIICVDYVRMKWMPSAKTIVHTQLENTVHVPFQLGNADCWPYQSWVCLTCEDTLQLIWRLDRLKTNCQVRNNKKCKLLTVWY